jgi:hypothetical protein
MSNKNAIPPNKGFKDHPERINLKSYKKGQSGNPAGRPKGAKSKKPKLKKLIKDLSSIIDKITDREKMLVYQLYDIAVADLDLNHISSSVEHLYFIESEFGIKIGKSKNVSNRLNQIKMYAPSSSLLKIINNAGAYESDLHRKFRYCNIMNNPKIGIEWFYKNDDLLSFIMEIHNVQDLQNNFNPKKAGQLLLF